MNFRLRQLREGSPHYRTESSSLYYGLKIRFPLLSTTPRDAAVKFNFEGLTYFDRDLHPVDGAPSRAHSQPALFAGDKI